MDVSVNRTGEVCIVEVDGSIDSKTAPDLQEELSGLIEENKNIVLDLAKVSFVSSAGLRVLLLAYRQLAAKNGKIILVGVSEEIHDVMHMTGFVKFFEICTTEEEALQKF